MSDRREALRRAFDDAFAREIPPGAAAAEALVEIVVSSRRYLVRRTEVAGVVRARRIVPLPGGPPALLGIAGHRGEILPVYSAAVALELQRLSDPGQGWLLVTRSADPVAFAVDRIGSIHPCPPGALVETGASGPVSERFLATGSALGVVRLERLVACVVGSSGRGSGDDG